MFLSTSLSFYQPPNISWRSQLFPLPGAYLVWPSLLVPPSWPGPPCLVQTLPAFSSRTPSYSLRIFICRQEKNYHEFETILDYTVNFLARLGYKMKTYFKPTNKQTKKSRALMMLLPIILVVSNVKSSGVFSISLNPTITKKMVSKCWVLLFSSLNF